MDHVVAKGPRPPAPVNAPRPTVGCAEALARLTDFDAIIDVRSPSEFAEDHLPGAINTPVLDDEQRARVGTLYRDCAFAARRVGGAMVARNIAAHLERTFADRPRRWRPLVYCWRGGQRSAAMVHVLRAVGWQAHQLEGGYRAFRRHVLAELAELPQSLTLRVICGPTGSGKSRLLRHLQRQGAQVLDLERIAQHRGSVLGAMPEAPQPTQKAFDSRLWQALRALDPRRCVFVESESRKVGQLRLPEALIERMRSAGCLRLRLPAEARVRLLRDEYAHFEADLPSLLRQLDCLVALHGPQRVGHWKRLAAEHRWDEMVARLLEEHYDPAYERSIRRNFPGAACAADVCLGGATEAEFDRAAAALAAG